LINVPYFNIRSTMTMAPQQGLSSWLVKQNSTASKPILKRKAAAALSTDEETPTGDDDFSPLPLKKKRAAPSSKPKAAPKAKKGSQQTCGAAYKASIAAIDKRYKALEKASTNIRGHKYSWTTSDDYAKAMATFLPSVRKLSSMDRDGKDGVILAFNLLLYLAERSYGDMDLHVKMCGYGEGDEAYAELDSALLELISMRAEQDPDSQSFKTEWEPLEKLAPRWTRDDADVGKFKTGRPNKQQRGWMAAQKKSWDEERREKARERREGTARWAQSALDELVDGREYLAPYGIEGFFLRSIAKLEGMKGLGA
jgi:hypothetical protein